MDLITTSRGLELLMTSSMQGDMHTRPRYRPQDWSVCVIGSGRSPRLGAASKAEMQSLKALSSLHTRRWEARRGGPA